MMEKRYYSIEMLANDDNLFWNHVKKLKKFYLSRSKYNVELLERRKEVVRQRYKDVMPNYDDRYTCDTCGSKDGSENDAAYCYICDTDNWRSKEPICD